MNMSKTVRLLNFDKMFDNACSHFWFHCHVSYKFIYQFSLAASMEQKDRLLGYTYFQAAWMDLDVERSLMSMNSLVATQLQEMEMVRQKVYSLEQTQIAIKAR